MDDLAIIGLTEPPNGDWAQLRALQYSKLHKVMQARMTTHAIATVLTLSLYIGKAPVLGLVAWVLAVAAVLWNALKIDGSLADVDRRRMSRYEYWKQAAGVGGIALAWSIPIVVFTPFGSEADEYALWTLIAMLVVSSALSMAAVPLATIIFSFVTGVTAILVFSSGGAYAFATVIAAFVALTISGTVYGARTYLSARIAELGVAEKSEVVSLLLREYEDNEADWLWQIDTTRRVRATSPRFAFALGMDPREIDGRSLIELIAGDAWATGQFPPSLHDLAERLKRRESFSNLIVLVNVANGRRWWELSGTPIIDESGSFAGFRGVGSDVTDKRESDEKIAYLARYDTLTGLPNRLMLTEALGDAMRFADQWKSRCAFLMIDLDRFKAVNDSLGHMVGDRLLAQVSARLKGVITDNEFCGRLGGDEFAIVIRDASNREVIDRVARNVIDVLSHPYDVDNHMLYVGASVGSAIGPRDGDSVEMLMRNADLALYRAKDEGGSQHYMYEPKLHADAEERRRMEFALRHAVGRNEMLLNFQPVVDANTEEVVSFEALVRWKNDEFGFVSPAKFIPLAEETRLIVPIGQWVFEEACRQVARWPDPVRININVSVEQLLEPGFSDTVVAILNRHGVPPHRVEIEVTESIFVRDAVIASQALERLMAIGCSIALDDFGTGYSSLAYLRDFRFSTIKVDRTFVQGAAQGNAESIAIVRAVVAMAESLQMTTTAEGVEDANEAKLIREMGCTKIQGYYFGRPMPTDEAFALAHRAGPVQPQATAAA